MRKTAKAGMRKQLVAQLRNRPPEAKGFEMSEGELKKQANRRKDPDLDGPKRRIVIDDVSTGDDAELLKNLPKAAAAKAEVLVLPCPHCSEELTYHNRSILQDGNVVHIGCKKAPKPKKDAPQVKRALSGLPKHKGAKVPEPPPPTASRYTSVYGDIVPCADYQGRTCIQLKRDVATVTFVPLDLNGLHLTYLPVAKFEEHYQPIKGYPVVKAVKKYLEFCKDYGATQDVLDMLARVVKPTEEERDMAKKKLTKAGDSKGASGAKKAGKASKGGPRGGIGELIRSLITAGKEPDDIVKAVKAKFPGANTKASNVSWYKNDMRQNGQKVPGDKKKAA